MINLFKSLPKKVQLELTIGETWTWSGTDTLVRGIKSVKNF